jgi:hypothetical protein
LKEYPDYRTAVSQEEHKQECYKVLRYNTNLIEMRYKHNLNRIKRESAHTRYWLCPTLMVVFGVQTYFGYIQADPIALWTGIVMVLVQVAFLVGFALFDKPVKL